MNRNENAIYGLLFVRKLYDVVTPVGFFKIFNGNLHFLAIIIMPFSSILGYGYMTIISFFRVIFVPF